jgi:hypothetical protein
MLDRQKLEALLSKRFPGATPEQMAAAANAIMGMIVAAGNPADGFPGNRGEKRAASGVPLPLR